MFCVPGIKLVQEGNIERVNFQYTTFKYYILGYISVQTWLIKKGVHRILLLNMCLQTFFHLLLVWGINFHGHYFESLIMLTVGFAL